jgi:hypothetical protein
MVNAQNMEHVKLRMTDIYHQLIAHEAVIIHLKHYNLLNVSAVLSHFQGSSRKDFLTPMDSYFTEISQHQLYVANTEEIKGIKC